MRMLNLVKTWPHYARKIFFNKDCSSEIWEYFDYNPTSRSLRYRLFLIILNQSSLYTTPIWMFLNSYFKNRATAGLFMSFLWIHWTVGRGICSFLFFWSDSLAFQPASILLVEKNRWYFFRRHLTLPELFGPWSNLHSLCKFISSSVANRRYIGISI